MNFDYQALGYEALRGALIAPIEVYVAGQPLTQIKNLMQANPNLSGRQVVQRLPKTLHGWYVGAVAHGSLSVPEIAVQYLAYEVFMQQTGSSFGSALFAGGMTALVSTPMDMLLITQNNLKISADEAVRRLGRNLFKGFVHTATRDTLFVTGYKWLNPAATDYLRNNFGFSELPANLVAGVVTGVAAGVFSQPFDTITTIVKSSVTKPGLPRTGREYIASFGWKATYSTGAMRYMLRAPISGIIFATWDRYTK